MVYDQHECLLTLELPPINKRNSKYQQHETTYGIVLYPKKGFRSQKFELAHHFDLLQNYLTNHIVNLGNIL